MKGLNVKRIAAIGLGAALVGSVLAPAVMAATYSNLTELKKENVVDSTGTPVVDIIVGSMGQAPDVVWAGNIAAKVAQLATIDVAGSGTKTVDITVGGTTSVSGAGETVESALSFTAAETAFTNIGVTNTKMPSLVNNPAAKIKQNSTDYTTISIQESLDGSIDAAYQKAVGSSNYAVGELTGSVAKGALSYSVDLGTAIDLTANQTNMDSNSRYDIRIPWLGKTYVVDEVNSTDKKIVMYSDTTPTNLEVGQTVTVTPAAAYAGKAMVIELVDLIQVGSGNTTYEPKWALKIDGVVQKYVQKSATTSYNLKDEFGTGYFSDSIYVTSAGLNLVANKYTATIRTGTSRLELRDGKGYPYTGDSTVDSKSQWKVVFNVATAPTKITLENQWKYDKVTGSETDTSKNVLKVGEEITLPDDFAKFKFVGFQTKPSTEVVLGNSELQYVDQKGTTITVPLYKQFDIDFNAPVVVTIADQEYTFWLENGIASAARDLNVAYIKGNYSSATAISSSWTAADLNFNGIGTMPTIGLDLGAKNYGSTASRDINYVLVADESTEKAFLLLKGAQTFPVYNKAHDVAKTVLEFIDTNNAGTSTVAYYYPNIQEFIADGNVGNDNAAYDSDNKYAAKFTYTDGSTVADVVSMYLKADEAGDVWNYEAMKNETGLTIYGPNRDATNGSFWDSAIRDGSDYLLSAFATDGTDIVSDNAVFTLTVPEEARLVEAYLGATGTSTTTTGGTKYTNVAVGETQGNVTIDVITGATSGKQIVKVGNIVKLDTDSAYGKSIIVGGFLVNKAAKNLPVDGKTLEERLTAAGDYVSAVLADGKIVVAGYTADDTATAAKELIAVLDGF